MAFEAELAPQGVEDGFDPLADAAEVPQLWFLVLFGWVGPGDGPVRASPRLLPAPRSPIFGFANAQSTGMSSGRNQIQTEPPAPKIAGVGGAVEVTVGEVGSFRCFSGHFEQGREYVARTGGGVANPQGLGVELEQMLGDDQAQQLGIGKSWLPAIDTVFGQADPARIRSSTNT